MKYPKINSLDLENKILLASLGIGILTIIFLWVHKQNKIVEGIEGVGAVLGTELAFDTSGMVANFAAEDAIMTQVIIQTDVDVNSALTNAHMTADTIELQTQATSNTVALEVQADVDTVELTANEIKEGEQDRAAGLLESVDSKVLDRVQKATIIAGTGADIAAQGAQLAALNAQHQIQNMAQTAANATATGMQAHGWKIAILGFLAASGVGAWAITNIEVLIYRISNFKSCFLWYFLEIIGWLLYLPIEFIVWLFCLHDFEKYAWKGLDGVDCFINDITGFYLFKHSDAVNQKCYSKVFTSLPTLNIPFSFDTVGNSLNDLYDQTNAVPEVYGGADQIQANVDQANNDAKVGAETAIALDSVMVATTAAQIGIETSTASIP